MAVGHTDPQLLAPALEADVDTDQVIRSLGSPRRRYVLSLLSGRDAPMALADVATDVTRWELDADREETSNESIQAVEVSLSHTDGPMQADVGLLEYDPQKRTIELTTHGPDVVLGGLPSIEEFHDPDGDSAARRR